MVLSRAKPAAPRELTAEESLRLEVLHVLGRGLGVLDPVTAMYVKARYLVDAMRSGNRAHLILAAAAEASSLAAGGREPSKREKELFETARTLSENGKDPAGFALYQITYGVCEYLRGGWRPALRRLDQVSASLAAVRRWNANAALFSIYALVYMGNLRETKARTLRLLADAEQRGDLYTTVNLRASHPMAAWLGLDDVAGARRHLRESMQEWPKTGFLVQHWQSMLWESEVELYAGNGAAAWDRLQRDARDLRRSGMFSVQLIEILTHFVRGRSAVASAGLAAAEHERRLTAARRDQKNLEDEGIPVGGAARRHAGGEHRPRERRLHRRAVRVEASHQGRGGRRDEPPRRFFAPSARRPRRRRRRGHPGGRSRRGDEGVGRASPRALRTDAAARALVSGARRAGPRAFGRYAAMGSRYARAALARASTPRRNVGSGLG